MKKTAFFLLAICSTALNTHAQWVNKTYALADGWNSIWLSGDASYATVSDLLSAYPNITDVWRWNPNPDQVTFTTSPSLPTTQSEEWTIWKRGDANEQTLSRFIGNSAYLIHSEGATSLVLKQKPLPPAASWQISGANFLGFPALSQTPTFSKYFASFPSANTTVLSPSSKIYKYTGGPLNASNPIQVSPSTETIDPQAAYWFQTATVSNFTAPLEYELPSDDGLAFGRTLNSITVGVTNRSTTSLTLTINLENSVPAPSGQPGINGSVTLFRRVFNSSTGSYDQIPIEGSFTVTLPASGRANLDFGVDRRELTNSNAHHASILRIRDTSSLTDVRLPVSAQAASTAGLWLSKATVSNVVNISPNPSGSTTSRPFELIFLMHVDGEGVARLLSQAYVGALASPGNPRGIAISEDAIQSYAQSGVSPQRYFAAQMPLVPFIAATGSVAIGDTATCNISIPYDDPTNPFVHSYHPDHDNLDASFALKLGEGQESYSIGRTCEFTFTNEPPSGASVSGWGTTVLGGTYAETLTGLNSQPLQVSGTFAMRRISEIADIDLTPSED
ncbi:hypothetical protein [Pelagicoccus sp. SDUM812002]|uniref:hypothetical protein n=1 Tax=Pelagicoccus sp. SDUM812002 TaxID=3041266 RepID=UPI0028101B93|nr:hypothetical protein [Pelagicoccus sp. SDUM812002]MDQ8187410.1 hypothetical protein [Pelagicoccus sp. SDUM812002]